MPYVQSAAIESLAYDSDAHRLRATFRSSGRTYEYEDVPEELYDQLMFADSLGAFFNAHIRDQFTCREIPPEPQETRRWPPRSASAAFASSSSAARSNLTR